MYTKSLALSCLRPYSIAYIDVKTIVIYLCYLFARSTPCLIVLFLQSCPMMMELMNPLYLLVLLSMIEVMFCEIPSNKIWVSFNKPRSCIIPFCDLLILRYFSITSVRRSLNLAHLPILFLILSMSFSRYISLDSRIKLRLMLWFLLYMLLLKFCLSWFWILISLAWRILNDTRSCLCSLGYLPSYGIGSKIALG